MQNKKYFGLLMLVIKLHAQSLQSCPTTWDFRVIACQAPLSWDSPGKIIGVACHAFLQGLFPDPGIKPSSPAFLALQADSFTIEPPGRPW